MTTFPNPPDDAVTHPPDSPHWLRAHQHSACGVGVLAHLDGHRSHGLIEDGFECLENLDHRGARGAEENTGDGAGMLLQKPHAFLSALVPELGGYDDYGVAQAFMPRDEDRRTAIRALIARRCQAEGFDLIGWRQVPTHNQGLGRTALDSEPLTWQFFIRSSQPVGPKVLDVRLYVLRRTIENEVLHRNLVGAGHETFYICSLSRTTVVYKGLLTCGQFRSYFPDLSDPRVTSSLVLVHARFSTNTLGAWDLAHPYRYLVHNGEINTLRGNQNWLQAREATLASPHLGKDMDKVKPLTGEGLSDSAQLDNVVELLALTGRSLPHALRMLIPEAWEKNPAMPAERRAFYEYHSALMEPWDGPALVVATDGQCIAAVLDRNGLRPCRYSLTRDGRLIMASETGVLDIPPSRILSKGRLNPGALFVVDPERGGIVPETQIFSELAGRPYGQWLQEHCLTLTADLPPAPASTPGAPPPHPLSRYQRAFGYTLEGLRVFLKPMAESGRDPIGAMGNDTPPAMLSSSARPLSHYFLQQFAQVSNPPLDYIREALVTSLGAYIGPRANLLEEGPDHCRQLYLSSPILNSAQAHAMRQILREDLRPRSIDITYPRGLPLRTAIRRLHQTAEQTIKKGAGILLLSDTDLGPERVAIPALLAVSSLHHHLIRTGLRMQTAIVLEAGQPCAVHDVCVLIGYGADAIHPWLAYQSIRALIAEGMIEAEADAALARYRQALEGGLLKVMSKMGISTLQAYKGAQIFESLGLDHELIDTCFTGTTAHLPGVGLADIEQDVLSAHGRAFGPPIAGEPALEPGGHLYWRRDGERHHWNPYSIGKLQQAARNNDVAAYRDFARQANEQPGGLMNLRGLLEFCRDEADAIPLETVEPAESIMRRFSTGSMSFGALSQEAHEALAIAMNRIGGKSGTGEGGEQPERFNTERECSMKQVASGRFGVSAHYLAQARQIEIKMAQGAKPGEGGELPGGKVDEAIARVRLTVPGVGLISPPPHHDIYSIEDLQQLIHDLKCANPAAQIHVKLVAKANVGTIAAGVAKARADAVLISGDSGGTGAALKTSIKHAGTPWELGLADTQRVLMANGLRSRITVRADGGFLTGRDVMIAALLGAEEYGFGTAPLVTLGCVMLRKCHCNTCSVGVATQDPQLRARFQGRPEHIVNYLRFVAEEMRDIMAALGFRTLDALIGRVDCLQARHVDHPRQIKPDVSVLLRRVCSQGSPRKVREQDHGLDRKIDHQVIAQADAALTSGEPVSVSIHLRNRDRTFGTLLSYEVTRRYGRDGLPPGTIQVHCTGTAGQSFGAFVCRGIALHLEGDANDYVGKGLSGGIISVRTPRDAPYVAADNTLIGNVALFGATAGEAYFNGRGAERFCVRNSGVLSVVEGVGDHGCEYMTGGVAVILGPIGRNFAAGMSGGEAYLLDEEGHVKDLIHAEGLRVDPVTDLRDQALLQRLLENHVACTGSEKAAQVLAQWPKILGMFVKVVPEAYADVVADHLSQGQDIRTQTPAPIA
ncbi:glutamate synthase large subunit [Ectothiorhodospira lacustris]|uniref:glutamate synthase large subunit n=1 Tax=Ectothiorhodospira lacustris TaxID=2899127 RepID=UPI001EE8F169|nr:glutamate synthase large subunit [Ectothiorhodospira lacustris]MCG5511358.1 glutamate synthase large subunit [Ectothiorhodospira lacustris]MCG5523144.1 glutamate synthase large subunit [Ectothiorhodospira lacustris]